VPQGSVLGPILLIIFINDLEEGKKNRLWKFADDTKLLGRVRNQKEVNELKQDLDKLICWTDKWQMKFNSEKCKVMHIGNKNPGQCM
jgi:ribonucleases P/MRP protein subunit RPP40